MKKNAVVLLLLSCFLSFGQDLETKKVEEKIEGDFNTTKKYSVLKSDPSIKHGYYKETVQRKVVVEGNYVMGKREGYWIFKNLKGDYFQKGNFFRGEKVGEWEMSLNGKTIIKKKYDSYRKLQSFQEKDRNENIIKIADYDPITQKYNVKEHIALGFYSLYESDNMVFKTSVNLYYPSGELLQKYTYKKGKLFEVSDVYKKNGQVLKHIRFSNGKGVLLNYYLKPIHNEEHFKVHSVVSYRDGEKSGMCLQYNFEEKILESGLVYKGNKIGNWKKWSQKKDSYEEIQFSQNDKLKFPLVTELSKEDVKKGRTVFFIKMDYGDRGTAKPMFESTNYKGSSKTVFSKVVRNHLRRNIDLSAIDTANEISNSATETVEVRATGTFKVNQYGEVQDIKIKSMNSTLKKEFYRVLESTPSFVPAFQNNRFVNLIFSLPLSLTLDTSTGGYVNPGINTNNINRAVRFNNSISRY